MPPSITEWLDDVTPGFGNSFAACFSEYGIDRVDYLRAMGAEEMAALKPLLIQAGAKPMHVKVIADAIAAAGTAIAPHAPGGPASSGTSPLKARVAVTKGGKQFGCFLSHHKASCAMEARFLKEKFEGLLSKEVFLDSDDLRGECNRSNSCDAEDTTH
jgi:hypothetical protein